MSSSTTPTHRPAPGRPYPVSTYRIQLRKEFGFENTQHILAYLKDLGVSHLYCSPYLQATPGSAHGYDVVNHSLINHELGGQDGFTALIRQLHHHGLRAIADIVPNHVSVADPEHLNPYWWDTLKHGRNSTYGNWFDVEWDHPLLKDKVLLPVLGVELDDLIKNNEIKYEDEGPADGIQGPIIRYYTHVFPVKEGTESLKGDLKSLLDAQHYKLAFWRVTLDGTLNYRRFFDVTTLAGIRVEEQSIFDQSHKIFIQQLKDGSLDGLRVDHPDGLADPQQYVERLAKATDGSWVVIEKILEEGEELPASWPCAGTSGYDSLIKITGLLVDRNAEDALTEMYQKFTGLKGDFNSVVNTSKHLILQKSLVAEVERLMSLLVLIQKDDSKATSLDRASIKEALVEFLVAFDIYRAYIQPGKPVPKESLVHIERATDIAKKALKNRRDAEVEFVARAATFNAGSPSPAAREFVSRLQQTCGPVMAKGIEDTAFYRYFRLVALNEVGGDPGVFGKSIDEFHTSCVEMQRSWSLSMTTLSTHDTKRSEDVRARLAVLSEIPTEWEHAVRTWSARAEKLGLCQSAILPDKNTEYLLWQTLVGAYPISPERLTAYMDKATREGKVHTTHTDANPAFDTAVKRFAEGVLADSELMAEIKTFVGRIALFGRLNSLTQKAIQLTMPGIPDVYQGCELEDYSLVDPDNRRPVDFDARKALLKKLDAEGTTPPAVDDTGAAKLWLVSRVLRLRRDHPDWFVGDKASYTPLCATGAKADSVVAFSRSDKVITVAPRLWVALNEEGATRGTTVTLPPGKWTNILTKASLQGGGDVELAELIKDFPIAVLVKDS
ncbi:hypothetical protein PhCBS80983_g04929 [Powellomyces hirtus]|uniref:Glycosyl hydrolase family 13 catalytic domain-containing protein n=1 Tax=Powellomyces hirtus TaxID=109895 RepID=A0A507DXK8_9FUNG|nr:hypothetical protein PhCBS80983_g04929 [Powellomyces hirtus]